MLLGGKMTKQINSYQELLTNHFGFVVYLGSFIMFGSLFVIMLIWPLSFFFNLNLPVDGLSLTLLALIGSLVFGAGIIQEPIHRMDDD